MNPSETTQLSPSRLSLTRVETAKAIGVTACTIDRLAERGLLHPSRATRRPLYPVWEIERFLRETSARITL
jgi:DNA-binding transcriptional MerR regulator